MRHALEGVLAAWLLAGCSLSAFDDRRATAWSDSNSGDGLSATDYGVAVAGVTTDRPGATIVGLGVNPVGLGILDYDQTGGLTLAGGDLPELASLTQAPTVISAPRPLPGASGLVAIGGLGALDQILFLDVSTGAPTPIGDVSGVGCGAAGSNLGHAMAFGFTSAGADNALDLVALRGNEVFLFPDFDPRATTPPCLRCTLPAPATDVASAVALIDIGFAEDAEIMVSIGGALTVFTATQLEEASAAGVGCFANQSPQIGNLTSPNDEPDFGAQLAVGDANNDGMLDVVATAPSTDSVYVVPNLTTSGPGGLLQALVAPADSGGFGDGPVAWLDIDGEAGDEVVVGDPLASPDGEERAGQVSVFTFSQDELVLRGVLHDSTPEPDQRFGRSIAATEFVSTERTELLVVGTADEVFTYFRAFLTAVDPRRP